MKSDLYTKIVLTVIAVALLLNVGLAVLTSKVEIRVRGKNQVGISHEVQTCQHCKGEITCCARRDDK